MNLYPLGMKGVLHVASHYANVGAHRREHDVIRVALARRLGVRLSHRESAYDFKHEVTALITQVSGFMIALADGVPGFCLLVELVWVPRSDVFRVGMRDNLLTTI
jgi:hypothetical protein